VRGNAGAVIDKVKLRIIQGHSESEKIAVDKDNTKIV